MTTEKHAPAALLCLVVVVGAAGCGARDPAPARAAGEPDTAAAALPDAALPPPRAPSDAGATAGEAGMRAGAGLRAEAGMRAEADERPPDAAPAADAYAPPPPSDGRRGIIASVTESVTEAGRDVDRNKGGPDCQKLTDATSPVRGGARAFKHWVDRCGERAELSMPRTRIGGTYWMGWSMMVYPPESPDTSTSEHIVQLPTYPTSRDFRLGCGAVGSIIDTSRGRLVLKLQRKGADRDIQCDVHDLGPTAPMKGVWVDFVMHAKWTGDPDGFLRLWIKVGSGKYELKVDHKGTTYWNDEGAGPYFKMGIYKGDPGWGGPAPRSVYTDEWRLGDETARFPDVAPGRDPQP
jgi:hypothetical protein